MRSPRRALITTFFATTLIPGPSERALAALPPVVEVRVPGASSPVHLALPAGFCAYPAEVRQRLAHFLLEGDVHLLGAAGDCAGIARLSGDGTAEVSPSMQVAILDPEMAPATRQTPTAYRRKCFEQFPPKQGTVISEVVRRSLTKADAALAVGGSASLGLLDATRDAVFGGMLVEFARGPARVLETVVTACFSPAGENIMWNFQRNLDRTETVEAITASIRSDVDLAEKQVAMTVELNRKSTQ